MKTDDIVIDRLEVTGLVDHLSKMEAGACIILSRPSFAGKIDKETMEFAEKTRAEARMRINLLKINYPHAFDHPQEENK